MQKPHDKNNRIAPFFKGDFVFIVLIILYVALFLYQINLPPLQRYPGWDAFWEDSRIAGKLLTLKQALTRGEWPTISPYNEFGSNIAGDIKDPVSLFSPFNYLILVFPVETVMLIRLAGFLILGAVGAYFYLKKITKDRFISFFGGLTYISLPIVIMPEFQFFEEFYVFYLIPILLILIHRTMERVTAKNIAILLAITVLAISSGGLYSLVVVLPTIFFYSLLIGSGYLRQRFWLAFKKAIAITILGILAGFFYIIPLFANLREISTTLESLRAAGVYQPGAGFKLTNFLNFFQTNNLGSLFTPNQSHGLLLYVPCFIYITLAISLVLGKFTFKTNPREAFVPASLVFLGLLMFAGSVFYYSIPGLSGASSGESFFRHHINLLPFTSILAGFICLAAIKRQKEMRMRLFVLIAMISAVVDLWLFSLPHPQPANSRDLISYISHAVTAPFSSSNRISIHMISDMWQLLPWVNQMFILLTIASVFIFEMKGRRNKLLKPMVISIAILVPLFNISLHNDLRLYQHRSWQWLTQSSYRLRTYESRKACLDQIIQRGDANYRTLYVGMDSLTDGTGRNWKTIAELELGVRDGEKALFSRKQMAHPFTGLLRGTFDQRYWRDSFWPPLSGAVTSNIENLRLMGVRYIVSGDEKIEDPRLSSRGVCQTKKGPLELADGLEGREGGPVYIYELKNPTGIAFLAERFEIHSQIKSFQTLFKKSDFPWMRGTVYLEKDPEILTPFQNRSSGKRAEDGFISHAEIVKEAFNSFQVSVRAPADKFLVLSYLYRRHWRARLDHQMNLPVYRAYGGFMAVQVPSGQHSITFRYIPLDVYMGIALTALAFIIPIFLFTVCSRYNLKTIRLKDFIKKHGRLFFLIIFILLSGVLGSMIFFKPSFRSRLLLKAQILAERGDCQESALRYEQALGSGAKETGIFWLWLGACYESQGNWQNALETYKNWIKAQPNNIQAWLTMGRLQSRTEKYEDAVVSFIKATDLDPRSTDGYSGLGLALFSLRRYQEAVDPLRIWLGLEPTNPRANFLLGLSYMRTGRASIAMSCLQSAMEQGSRFTTAELAQIYYALAQVSLEQNQYAGFKEALGRAAVLDRNDNLLGEAVHQNFDSTLVEYALRDALIILDCQKIVEESRDKLILTKSGKKIKAEGPIRLENGPRPGMKAVFIEGMAPIKTHLFLPRESFRSAEGSFSVWAKLATPSKTYADLIAVHGGSPPYSSLTFHIYIYHEASGRFMVSYNSGSQAIPTSQTITDDGWHHYALTWRADAQQFYIDGKLALSIHRPADQSRIGLVSLGWIGYPQGEEETWHGSMAEFISFRRALEPIEISAIFRHGASSDNGLKNDFPGVKRKDLNFQ